MNSSLPRTIALLFVVCFVAVACASGGGTQWTFAPAPTGEGGATAAPGGSEAPGESAAPGESVAPGESAGPGQSAAPGASDGPASSPPPAGEARVIELVADNALRFTGPDGERVTDIPVTPGETVVFRIDNTAGFAHNFWIGTDAQLSAPNGSTDVGIPDWSTGVQELEWVVPADVAGLKFGCTVPGHYPAGMQGTFSQLAPAGAEPAAAGSPAAGSPAAESPAAESPAADSPAAESPAAHEMPGMSPAGESPATTGEEPSEEPAAETPAADSTAPESPPAGESPAESAPPSGEARVIELVADNAMRFTGPDGQQVRDIPVTPGETVVFRIDNTAGFAHNFWIGTDAQLSGMNATTDAGIPDWTSGVQELEWVVPADLAGLKFGCTVPGHYGLMQGTFSQLAPAGAEPAAESPAAQSPAAAESPATESPAAQSPAAAESPAASPSGEARVIELEATASIRFAQDGVVIDEIAVTPGETVLFRIDNTAGFAHAFYIGSDAELQVPGGTTDTGIPDWEAGVRELEWVVPEDLTDVRFACTVPGHYGLMNGSFVTP